jgi:geranylgeranyl diphosphate synthase type I
MFLPVQKRLGRLLPVIDEEIKKILQSEGSADGYPNLYDGMEYALSSGGKRLRPALCMLACESLGGDIASALPVAAGIEIAHNSTLVHDDIEDGDGIRRGKPTVWKKFGTPHATNIGDGMIFKSYESINGSRLPDKKKARIIRKFTDAFVEIVEGQNMEFNFRERDDVTADEYMSMARKKAGILFGLSLGLGADIADAPQATQDTLYEFGSDMGLAFMIRDDILNLVGDQGKYGKEIGGDIKEGKRTLMAIDCLSKCGSEEKAKLLSILSKTRDSVTDKDVSYAIELMKKHGSIDFAQARSEEMVKSAMKKLACIESGELRKLLEEFSDFMVKRDF